MSVSAGGSAANVAASVQPPPEYLAGLAELRATQTAMTALIQQQQTTDSRLNETRMVKQELDALKEDEHAYKLMGKIMVRQDTSEARTTINGRLAMLEAEWTRLEKEIAAIDEKKDGQRRKLMEMQSAFAKTAGAGAGK